MVLVLKTTSSICIDRNDKVVIKKYVLLKCMVFTVVTFLNILKYDFNTCCYKQFYSCAM